MPVSHEADYLVVALGADYDLDATPGLADGDNEFYSEAGAARLAEVLPAFTGGRVVVGVCGAPFKCPPAPSECALLVHDDLTARGLRDDCEITFVIPFGTPVPPSPETSEALVGAFAERDITFVPGQARGLARHGPARGRARRRQRAAVRPLPRRAEAPRTGRGHRERDDRGGLRPRRLRGRS